MQPVDNSILPENQKRKFDFQAAKAFCVGN